MTYQSLYVESHEDQGGARAAYKSGTVRNVIITLNAYSFPKRASAFAQAEGLNVDYVDNAWTRIAIDGRLLKIFLAYGHATEPSLELYLGKVDDDSWYVINEEEF